MCVNVCVCEYMCVCVYVCVNVCVCVCMCVCVCACVCKSLCATFDVQNTRKIPPLPLQFECAGLQLVDFCPWPCVRRFHDLFKAFVRGLKPLYVGLASWPHGLASWA